MYSVEGDYPFTGYPDFEIFRHADNKWFALMGTILWKTLGVKRPGNVLFLNVKCNPLLIGSLRQKPGLEIDGAAVRNDRWETGAVPCGVRLFACLGKCQCIKFL